MTARLKDYARLGATLRRVRVADRPLEGGGKKVWHQGDQGAEVISFVDASGSVTRQECYVGGQAVVWQVDGPLVTGLVRIDAVSGDSVVADPAVGVPTVLNALSLLEGYTDDDKYLQHLRAVLRIAAERLPASGLDPEDAAALRRVTADQPVITPDEVRRFNSTGRLGQKQLLAAAVLGAALLAALAWLLKHR